METGIMGNIELIDALCDACEEAVSSLHSGRHIQFCKLMYGIVVRLAQLKAGIKKDIESRDKTIETLKERLRSAGVEVIDLPAENLIRHEGKDGANDGE